MNEPTYGGLPVIRHLYLPPSMMIVQKDNAVLYFGPLVVGDLLTQWPGATVNLSTEDYDELKSLARR